MRRRKLLKASGALLATGAIGTAAASEDNQIGLQTVGLEDRVIELIQNGNVAEARALLDEHGIEYDINSGEIQNSGHGGGRDGISIQGRYRNNADYDVGIIPHGDGENIYYAFGNITFNERAYSLRDASIIDDGMAIVWADSDWTGAHPDADGVQYWSGSVADSVGHEDYIPGRGVAGSVELDRDYNGGTVGMGVKLEKIRGGADSVQFEYEHTWALLNTPGGIGDVSIGISYGGLSVSLPIEGSTAWTHEEAATL